MGWQKYYQQQANRALVVVHGGGYLVDELMDKLQLETIKKEGLRVTPKDQIGYIAGALAGTANKMLQGQAMKSGVKAIGLSLADGGTLFLDEIGEMPLAMQVKLLRVLQEGTFFPVGGREQKHIDIRVISATNADLLEKVREGEFREDLFYRIKGVNIETLALADRLDDVPVLLQAFLQRWQSQHATMLKLSPDAVQWFRDQTWPGNVRELKNTLESVASICPEGRITLDDIQLLYPSSAPVFVTPLTSHLSLNDISLDEQVRDLEIRLITQALEKHQGNRTQAAKQLGISRQGLIKKIERYGV